jgi:hypothetical protein
MAIDTSAFDSFKKKQSGTAYKTVDLSAFGGTQVQIKDKPVVPPAPSGFLKEIGKKAPGLLKGKLSEYIKSEEDIRAGLTLGQQFKRDIITKPAQVVKFLVQGAAQVPVMIGRSALEAAATPLGKKEAVRNTFADKGTNADSWEKTLLGGKVDSYQQITEKTQEFIDKSPYSTSAEKKFLAPVMGLALFASDAFPGKPNVKRQALNLFEELAKDVNPASIEKKLVDFGIDDNSAKRLAPKLVEAGDINTVRQTIADDAGEEVARLVDVEDAIPTAAKSVEDFTKGETFTLKNGKEGVFEGFVDTPKGKMVMYKDDVTSSFSQLETVDDFKKIINEENVIKSNLETKKQLDEISKKQSEIDKKLETDLFGFGGDVTPSRSGKVISDLNKGEYSKLDLQKAALSGKYKIVTAANEKVPRLVDAEKWDAGEKIYAPKLNKTQKEYFEYLSANPTLLDGLKKVDIPATVVKKEVSQTPSFKTVPEGASGVVDEVEIPAIKDLLKRDQVTLRPTRARGAMDIKGRDLRKEMENNISRYNAKIPDPEIRSIREQNLLNPESIDEIILRKRGIITDAEAIERAKKIQGTLQDVIDLPKGTVLTKEQYTGVEQIVQNEREINKALKEALDQGIETGGVSERKLIKELGEEYSKMSDAELLRQAFQESTVKLRKAEIVLMGARSEAGRALQATKQYVEGVDQRLRILFNRLNQNKKLDEFQKQAIVETIAKMDLADNKQFLKELDKLVKPDFFDKLAEYSVAVKLFNPTTHIVNLGGNAVRQLLDVGVKTATNPLAAKADMAGAAHGLKIGLKSSLKALSNEGYARNLAKWVETGGEAPAIGGKVGEVVRLPFRALGASDEIFRNTAFHRKMYRDAYGIAKKEGLKGKQLKARMEELLNTPTFDMVERANKEAKRMTFQEDMGEIVKKINRMRDPSSYESKAGKTLGVTIRAFVPFLNTPTNLFKQAVDFSPLGIPKNWKSLKEAAKAGDQEKVGTILGEALIGSALAAYIAMETIEGNITGGVPSNPAEKDRFYREKKLPYAIKVGDKWYQYQRLDPLALIMGMTSDLTNADEKTVGSLIGIVTENLKDKTYLSGVSDLMKLLTGEDWEREYSFKSMLLGMTAPSFIGHIARSVDPTVRQADTIGQRLVAQTPGLSEELPARVNVLGYDVERANKGLNYFFNPIQSASAELDPVTKGLMEIDKSISVPNKTFEKDKVKYELTPAEYEDFARYTGVKLRSELSKLFKSEQYKRMDDEEKSAKIDVLRKEAMDEWKEEYLKEQTGDVAKIKKIREQFTGKSTSDQIKEYFLAQ